MIETTLRIDKTKTGYIVTPSTNDLVLSEKIGEVVNEAIKTLNENTKWSKLGSMKNKKQAIQYKNTIADLLTKANIEFTDIGIKEVV